MTKKRAKHAPAPTQPDLIPDRAIKDLEDAAAVYAEIRDHRQAWTASEFDAKEKLLALMKRHKKRVYERPGLSIEIITEKERVKVRIRPEDA